MERWKPIPNFLGYEASDQGRIRSFFTRGGPRGWRLGEKPARILKPSNKRNGYLDVMLRRDGKTFRQGVGNLVALTFLGPCPPGLELCHSDGDKRNNFLENLRYDTHQANMSDYQELNLAACSRLSNLEVRHIREGRANGASLRNLGLEYGLTVSAVSLLVRGKRRIESGGPIQRTRKITGLGSSNIMINFKVRQETKRALRHMAADHDLTLSEVLRRIVLAFLALPEDEQRGTLEQELTQVGEER